MPAPKKLQRPQPVPEACLDPGAIMEMPRTHLVMPAPPRGQRFRYLHLSRHAYVRADEWQEAIAKAGDEGWRMVTVDQGTAYFVKEA